MKRIMRNFGWYLMHLKTHYALFLLVLWPIALLVLILVFNVGTKKTWAEEQGLI